MYSLPAVLCLHAVFTAVSGSPNHSGASSGGQCILAGSGLWGTASHGGLISGSLDLNSARSLQELQLQGGWLSPKKIGDYADIACTVPAATDDSIGVGGGSWKTGEDGAPKGPDSLSDLSGTGDQALNELLFNYYANQGYVP